MRERTTSRVTAADRPYGKFYDFYSVSPENFGSTNVAYFHSECLFVTYLMMLSVAQNVKH